MNTMGGSQLLAADRRRPNAHFGQYGLASSGCQT